MPNAKTGAVLTLMVALVATPFTHAEPMSDTQCQTAKDGIEADHEAAMRACDRLVDPDARDAGTDGKPEPALSELEFQDSSSKRHLRRRSERQADSRVGGTEVPAFRLG
jgi:hypothetical protein